MPELTFYFDRLPTPIGELILVSDPLAQLRALDWIDYESRMHVLLKRHYEAFRLERAPSPHSVHLISYFAGNCAAVDQITTATGGTQFQRLVWQSLRAIPLGSTTSYGQLASRIGSPKAVRAVGLANGSNPIGIVIPCHRVIGANGSLTGYGGGLVRKQWLLDHERQCRGNHVTNNSPTRIFL